MSMRQKLSKIIGERIKALRLQNKWSQDALAQSIGIKTDTLRHIEKGRNDPRILCLSNIAKIFGVELSTLVSGQPLDLDKIESLSWQPDITVDLVDYMTKRDMTMDRRSTLMALTATIISGPTLFCFLDEWLKPLKKASEKPYVAIGKLGIEEIDQLKQAAQSLYEWRMRFGGGPCRLAAVGLLNEVASALKEPQTSVIESELYRIMADLANTAATMSWQSGFERDAQDYYKLAIRAAYANNDRLFGARVLAVGLSRQMIYQGKPQEALELVHFAQYGTRHIAGPQVNAMLYIREAWALSAIGREPGFQRAVTLARESAANANSGEEPDWIAPFCNEEELAGIAGTGLTELSRYSPRKYAELACEQSLTALNIRGERIDYLTALDYIGLAESRFLLKDTELAVTYTQKAIAVSKHIQSSSRQVRGRLEELYQYTNQHTGSRPVREVNMNMKRLLANA